MCFLAVCFKIFDIDRDGLLNPRELQHMREVLMFVAQENRVILQNQKSNASTLERQSFRKSSARSSASSKQSLKMNDGQANVIQRNFENEPDPVKGHQIYHGYDQSEFTIKDHLNASRHPSSNEALNDQFGKTVSALNAQVNSEGYLSQEDFLVWSSANDCNVLVDPFLELLFQVCHVSLGLKPLCRHHEYTIGELILFNSVLCIFYCTITKMRVGERQNQRVFSTNYKFSTSIRIHFVVYLFSKYYRGAR